MSEVRFANVFSPIRVGTLALDHRLVVPPHAGGSGSLLGSEESFERHCRYWLARIDGGIRWVGGGPIFVRNPLIPGFEPTGVGAHGPGLFRDPDFSTRLVRFMDRLHAAGGVGTVQMVLQGGMPLAPSATLSGYSDHRIPHVLDVDEIRWLVREYGESAAIAAGAGADALELHANHDDLLQWFLSPRTNQRLDGYGGGFENRRRFLREVVESLRAAVDRPITIGLRLCLDEMIDDGYGIEDCQRLLAAFEADATVDYFSLDVGSNWGTVSYIPPGFYSQAQWSPLCGQAKQATGLPVIYVGRVTRPEAAERILAAGQADLVGMARAHIADPEIVLKTRRGLLDAIRPCIGVMDCIDRRIVEGLPFSCAANPSAGHEDENAISPSSAPRSILVIGGGPAGSEFAALAAQRGHRVQLWEREDHLGGQLAIAALARMNTAYAEWIAWQDRRLTSLGVDVAFCRDADRDAVLACGVDHVVVATGARPRRPVVPGVNLPHVVGTSEVLTGQAQVGRRVVVIAADDRAAPLAVADHLAGDGHEVTLVFETPSPAPLVGKYSIGAMLARLDDAGVALVAMARLTSVEAGAVRLANVYSGRCWALDAIDTVVLACGSVSDDGLYQQLKGAHTGVHLLGDAFAPRRMAFATRQAWELARLFD